MSSIFPGTLTFEVAFNVDVSSTPASGDWTDLSSRVRVEEGLQIDYGSPQGGRCTLALNNRDRALDPTNTSATYNLVPMRHARLQLTIGATTYDLWRGFVEEWPPVWGDGTRGIVHVALVDATVWLALEVADLDLPAQTTAERITALLDEAGWPAGLRDLDVGLVDLDAYEQEGENLLRVLIDTADAEDGVIFVAPDGTFTFRNRHHTFAASATLSTGTGGVAVTGVTPVYGGNEVVNTGRVEMADGTVFEQVDASSVTAYGVRTESIRDLSLPWYEANGLADWTVHKGADPQVWLDGLTLHDHGQLGSILAVRPGDRVDFAHEPPGSGTASVEGVVGKIGHRYGEQGFQTVLDLSPYFGEGPWLTLDDATLGQLDTTNKVAP